MHPQKSKTTINQLKGDIQGVFIVKLRKLQASRPCTSTDPPKAPRGAPAVCSHAHIFCKICKRYFSCNQTTVSLHSDFQSVPLPPVLGGTGVVMGNLGIFLEGKLSWEYSLGSVGRSHIRAVKWWLVILVQWWRPPLPPSTLPALLRWDPRAQGFRLYQISTCPTMLTRGIQCE